MKRYKFLTTKGKKIVSKNGNLSWEIGKWNKIEKDLDICSVGLHCSKGIYEAFSYVQGNVLAEVEVKGKSIKEKDKEAWSEMRIVRAWKWQKKDSVALAVFSAELVIKNYEDKYPDDDRLRKAIEAAKRVLANNTVKNRSAAYAAGSAESAAESAWSAAESAAYAAESAAYAARSAAYAAESAAYAAESAAYAAESAAESAWSAAESAAESAARSAWSAWSAAESAARSAAWSAAWFALIKKIEKWFTNHLEELEEIK